MQKGIAAADTVYNRRPWGMPAPTVENQALGPDRTNVERITGERLQQALLAQAVPPTVLLFRPRYGYRDHAIGIAEILNVDSVFPPPNVGTWHSGGPAETNSSSTYTNYSATFGNL
jgi:hypothetical protein